jgi:hypothetical protein
MADIFLSYATEDRATASRLVGAFEAVGWSVFWDRVTPVGKSWDRVLEQQLSVAGAITPLWSPTSVESDWVLIEATEGMERKKLFPALIAREDKTRIPIRFKLTEYADLSDWDGTRSHQGCTRLLTALANQLNKDVNKVSERVESQAKLKFRRRREQHDVFLGYARNDHAKAALLTNALEAAGVAVWSDRAIAVGESFAETIMGALKAAKAVVILWTEAGVRSEWVRAEAQFALNAGTLIGVLAEPVMVQPEFASVPTLDLATWRGDTNDPGFQRLLHSVTVRGHGPREEPVIRVRPIGQSVSDPSFRFTWVHIVAAAVLAGMAGAVLVFLLLRAV